MSIVMDIIIAAIVVIGMIYGIRRGFVKTVAKPVRIVAVLAVAFSFCGTVGAQYIQPYIQAPISERMSAFLTEKCADITAANAAEELPTLLKLSAGLFNIDVNTVAGEATGSIISSITDALTSPVASVIASILAFIVLYILASIAFVIVVQVIHLVFSIGPLRIFNKFFGFIFGTLFALIIAWAFVAVFELALGLPFMEGVAGFERGFLYSFLNELHPIDLLLSF